MGWDEYREVVFVRQKELGIFPAEAELSPRDPDVPEWKTLSNEQKKLYAHFMEVYAGFLEHCDHHTQYFEMFANRAIYHEGWRADCGVPGPSDAEGAKKDRKLGDEITPEILDDLDNNGSELYHVTEDPAECHNLTEQYPQKHIEMITRWYIEAGKYNVLPLDSTLFQRLAVERPRLAKKREQMIYYPNLSVVPLGNTPMIFNRPYSITAEVEIPSGGAEGVLLAQGGVAGGYILYVKDKKLHYLHNYLGLAEYTVTSKVDVPEGKSTLRYEFEPTGMPNIASGKGAPGRAQLYINGELVGNTEFPMTVPLTFGIEGLSCGYDCGEAVTHKYHAPFTFTGLVKNVTVDLSGDLIEDDEAKVRLLMAHL
jgi:hypothetical protein